MYNYDEMNKNFLTELTKVDHDSQNVTAMDECKMIVDSAVKSYGDVQELWDLASEAFPDDDPRLAHEKTIVGVMGISLAKLLESTEELYGEPIDIIASRLAEVIKAKEK